MAAQYEEKAAVGRVAKTIAYRPVFAQVTGSVTAGLLLSQLYYWATLAKGGRPRTEGGRWIWKSHTEWQQETGGPGGLTRWETRVAIEKIKALGVLETKNFRANGHSTTHYWLDIEKLRAIRVKCWEGESGEVTVGNVLDSSKKEVG